MRVIIEQDYDRLSKWAANHVIERINAFKPSAERPFVLGLPTGSSPEGMYAELVKACRDCPKTIPKAITASWPVTCSTISTAPVRTSIY